MTLIVRSREVRRQVVVDGLAAGVGGCGEVAVDLASDCSPRADALPLTLASWKWSDDLTAFDRLPEMLAFNCTIPEVRGRCFGAR